MTKTIVADENDFGFIVCHSEDIDSGDAVQDLIEQADAKLVGKVPNACILFSAIDYDHQIILDEINRKWNDIQLVGGTTDGEMSSELGFAEDSVVMILFRSNSTVFTAGVGDLLSEGIEKACKKAVDEAFEDLKSEPQLCFTIPGNIGTNNDKIVASLKNLLNDKVPIFGGIPGDQLRFKEQYQFCGNKVFTDSVPILLFSGDFLFEYGLDSGWNPVGEIGNVSKAEERIVYEINNKPAIDFYKNSLAELVDPSGEFPIVILNDENKIKYQRTLSHVLDDNSGAIAFLGGVPQGSKIQIAHADRKSILEGTKRSINEAINKLPKRSKIKGCLFISCAARKVLLGTHTKEEIKIAEEIIGNNAPIAGFYGYGELSPIKTDSTNSMVHNQTFVTILFGIN